MPSIALNHAANRRSCRICRKKQEEHHSKTCRPCFENRINRNSRREITADESSISRTSPTFLGLSSCAYSTRSTEDCHPLILHIYHLSHKSDSCYLGALIGRSPRRLCNGPSRPHISKPCDVSLTRTSRLQDERIKLVCTMPISSTICILGSHCSLARSASSTAGPLHRLSSHEWH